MRWLGLSFLIGIISAGVVSTTLAFDEPDGFRGVPWGASENEMLGKIGAGMECASYSESRRALFGDRFCSRVFRLGPVSTKVMYSFRADRFTRAQMSFASQDFDQVAAILIERYGPPTSDSQQPNKDRTLMWAGPNILITAKPGSMYIGARAELEELQRGSEKFEQEESERQRRQQIKDAAKGL
jgi:hypothetical protein